MMMIVPRTSTVLGLATLLTVLTACGSPDGSSLMEIYPAGPEIEPGRTGRFVARVAGTLDSTASWTVVESDGGTIDAEGNYTAPATEGTYTVVASVDSIGTTETTRVKVSKNLRVKVSPSAATLQVGESLAFTTSVNGSLKAVNWSLAEAEGGTIAADGVYTPPNTPGTYTIVATSAFDAKKFGTAIVTVTAAAEAAPPSATVSVAISPQTASIEAGNSVQFSAKVSGATDTSVTWSVTESGGGTVSAKGLYTAPATAGTYHLVATSTADATKSASATITVAAPPVELLSEPPPQTVTPTADDANWADVQAFGARGDGVTDDTAAFRAAAATGKNLRIPRPPAHYKLTGKVRVYGSVVGDGSMPEIRMYGANGKELYSMIEVIDYTGAGLVISGLHLNGQWDGVSTSGEWSHNILVKGSKNVTIENNVLERPFGDNILLGGEWNPRPSENIVIRNNRMSGPRRCNIALIYATGVKIDGNVLHKWNDYVTSIDLEPNPYKPGYSAYESVWNVSITNNQFDVPRQTAVLLYHFDWGYPPDGLAGGDVVITGNTGRARRFFGKEGNWVRITRSNNF
jgi:hypothetical protein